MSERIEPSLIEQARQCDLLALAGRHTQLKRVAAAHGGEYAGPCPLCPAGGGRDRFRVQPEEHRWLCRYCTQGKWRDAIDLQRRLTGQSFVEAVQALAGDTPATVASRARRIAAPKEEPGPPGTAWQERAQAVIEQSAVDLWKPCGERAREWLHARGLEDNTLLRWRVGYIDEDHYEACRRWGFEDGPAIHLPRGVLIPCVLSDLVWYLKIRRPKGQPKYTQVRGGRPALYMASTLQGPLACVTEGEFDALLLWQSLQRALSPRLREMGVTTLGSQSNRLDLAHWARYLYPLQHLMLLYDQDGKSENGIRYWTALTPRAIVVHWSNLRPGDKDVTDYYRAGGNLLDLVALATMQAGANVGGGPTAQQS